MWISVISLFPDMYELIVMNDLSAMVGIEGWYILMKRDHGLGDYITFQIDPSMNFTFNTYKLVGSRGCYFYYEMGYLKICK